MSVRRAERDGRAVGLVLAVFGPADGLRGPTVTGPGNMHPTSRDPHPSWVVPFWILFALAAMFLAGAVCGAGCVVYVSMSSQPRTDRGAD